MLHDAQFWELPNTRGVFCQLQCWCGHAHRRSSDAFLAQLNEQTAPLDKFGLAELLTQLAPHSTLKTPKGVSQLAAAYGVLLLAPSEYIPRPTQVELLKRGLVADVLTFQALCSAKKATATTNQLLVIREFLRRTIAFLGNVESVVRLLETNIRVENTKKDA